MITKDDCTLFSRWIDPVTRVEKFTRIQIRGVMWADRKAANVIKSGLLEADSVAIYIPFARGPLTIKPGDVLVKGLVIDEITSIFTMTDLREKYAKVVTIRSVDENDDGSPNMRHWRIGAG